MTIIAQTIVKNEQNWVWYAINSVVDYVDEILVWDTGSTDSTVEIIKSISSPKIKFRQVTLQTAQDHTNLRQQMLDATNSEWFLTVDGDEIWWKDSLRAVISAIHNHPDAAAIISPFYNAVGDVFHYVSPRFINYHIREFIGGYTIRAINRRLPGLHIANPHGRQEYRLGDGTAIQHQPQAALPLVNYPYLHTTHLARSPVDNSTLKRSFKFRYDLGWHFPSHVFPPEVFYFPRPKMVPSPWTERDLPYLVKAAPTTPLRYLRYYLRQSSSSGY